MSFAGCIGGVVTSCAGFRWARRSSASFCFSDRLPGSVEERALIVGESRARQRPASPLRPSLAAGVSTGRTKAAGTAGGAREEGDQCAPVRAEVGAHERSSPFNPINSMA